MPILKIYSLDDQDEASVISAFPEGEHSIGRDKLNCKDKRISRNHALITITNNSITLHSTHVNPSFYKPHGGNSIRLVKKDESVTINDGDQFAFLADAYWFKTRIKQDEINLASNSNKRIHEESEIYNQKKAKVDNVIENKEESTKLAVSDNVDNQENKGDVSDSEGSIDFAASLLNGDDIPNEEDPKDTTENNTSIVFATSLQNEDDIPNEEDPKDTTENNLEKSTDEKNPQDTIPSKDERENILNKEEESTEQNDTENNINNDNEVNPLNETTQNDESKEETKPDTGDCSTNDQSTSKTKREPCWYGAKCYRKNAAHKQAFSHPGDSDYEDNEVAECPYGTGCYRTNAIHRKQYKHTKPPAPKPVPAPATTNNDGSEDEESDDDSPVGKKKRKATTKAKNYAETPEDDYDLQDPFINDGSSDDFEMTDDDEDDDDDWQDSQEADEESQDTRRLLKEAKKFTRKKNKK